MILFNDKKECSGCTACMNSCPKSAISMVEDKEGFFYPNINQEACIECGICKKVCPFSGEYINKTAFKEPLVYAVKNKSTEIRMNSASGGVFTAISDYILSKSGVVYGAMYDTGFKVVHSKAEGIEERNKFRGSKYVQSYLGNIFEDVKRDLDSGRYVLFSGTPCQVAGLDNFLMKDYEKLIKCDIVCHGTPSPKIFKDYLSFIEEKYNSKISKMSFRDKEQGWQNQKWKIEFENGSKIIDNIDVNIYKKIFYGHFAQRPSCHSCKFTNLKRPSDITIGDYWSIEKVFPDFVDEKGVNLVLLTTSKGLDLFNDINSNFEYLKSDTNSCLQPQLQYPTSPSNLREQFWNDYNIKGFTFIVKKYTKKSFLSIIKRIYNKSLDFISK